MGVKDVQFISDKQWLAGIRDIIELHKYGRADEVRTVHRLASTREERYQKALEYLEGKRGQQGKPAGAREGRREDSRGNLLAQGKEGGQQGKPAGASKGGRKERGRQGEPAGASKRGGRREDSRGNLLEQARGGRKERGQQGDLVFTTFGSAEGGHARKYSNKFGISLTYP